VVTGGGSGIGAAIVERFSRAGAAAVYVLERDIEAGRRVAESLGGEKAGVHAIECDVANADSVERFCADLLARGGRCDVLVNNAGIGHVGTILDTTLGDLERLWAVNVKGVFHLSRRLLPAMIDSQSGGSIINLASIGGVLALRERLAYCTTKFDVVGMTKCMAIDHAAQKVRVNCICPGRVETPFVQARLKEYPDPQRAYEELAASHPLNRMARPEEIAAAALYLASDEAAFVTGSCLVIDGGLSAGK